MNEQLVLSILDLCEQSPQLPNSERVSYIVERAMLAEQLGYKRYWLTEHHNSEINANPEMLTALVAANTSNIMVGPAGILLTYYNSLRVSSTFSFLESLYPGRINLGVCRGQSIPEISALLLGEQLADFSSQFEDKTKQLLSYLRLEVRVPIVGDVLPGPEVWLHGSGWASMRLAAQLGSSYCHSIFHANSQKDPAVIHTYFETFQGKQISNAGSPAAALAVSGICAETEREAYSLLGGHANPHVVPNVVGDPTQCRAMLLDLKRQFQISEIVFLDLCKSPDDSSRSIELLSEELLG